MVQFSGLTWAVTFFILVQFLPVSLVHSCNRYRYYGEPCLGYDRDKCDSRRMLKCDVRTGSCQCPDLYYNFYDNYNARCYHRIGTACKERFGGVDESWYNHFCPDNSFCNPGTGYCQCLPLYRANFDGTGCFLGNAGIQVTFGSSILIPILLLFRSLF